MLDADPAAAHRDRAHPLTSVFLAGLLALAGGTKLLRPAATSQAALCLSGLPSRSWLVRLLGAGEVLVAVAALLEAPFAAAVLAATYVAFTVFVGVPLASCGCFAEPDVPPTPVHVAVTAALAACAAADVVGVTPGRQRPGLTSYAATSAAAGRRWAGRPRLAPWAIP